MFLVFWSFSRAAPHTPRSATADPHGGNHYEDGDGAGGEYSGGSSRRRQQPLGRSVGSQSPFRSAHHTGAEAVVKHANLECCRGVLCVVPLLLCC